MVKFKLWDNMAIPMFDRKEWGAAEYEIYKEFDCTELPLTHVRFCYDDMMTKYNTTETVVALRECQREHMQVQGFEDIKYNFAVNAEGIIYQCRGWFTVPATPVKYLPLLYKVLDICFIGNYSDKDPPWPQMRTALHIVMKGLRTGFIESNFRLIGLRDPEGGKLEFI